MYGGSNAASQLRSWGIPAAEPNQGKDGDSRPDWTDLFNVADPDPALHGAKSPFLWLKSSISVMCGRLYIVGLTYRTVSFQFPSFDYKMLNERCPKF